MTPQVAFYRSDEVLLQSGASLHDCKLAYVTHGKLNAAKDNAIVFPTWFAGDHTHNEWLIGPGKALDSEKYFIIIPNLLGNGLSTSPSNFPEPSKFPKITLLDNIRLQHRLVTEVFGIERLKLVVGSSMGALQTYHWAALYPDIVERIAPFCGAARCSRHNQLFIEGIRAALTADGTWNNGEYTTQPHRGLQAMARVYSGWGFSQAFFREHLDRTHLGFHTLDEYIIGVWENAFRSQDANNLLAMMWSWQNADISANDIYHGDFKRALASITAKAFVMPGKTDLYFPPEDSEFEVAHMPNATFLPIPSIWGHMAGGPGINPEDGKFIDDRLKELLAT